MFNIATFILPGKDKIMQKLVVLLLLCSSLIEGNWIKLSDLLSGKHEEGCDHLAVFVRDFEALCSYSEWNEFNRIIEKCLQISSKAHLYPDTDQSEIFYDIFHVFMHSGNNHQLKRNDDDKKCKKEDSKRNNDLSSGSLRNTRDDLPHHILDWDILYARTPARSRVFVQLCARRLINLFKGTIPPTFLEHYKADHFPATTVKPSEASTTASTKAPTTASTTKPSPTTVTKASTTTMAPTTPSTTKQTTPTSAATTVTPSTTQTPPTTQDQTTQQPTTQAATKPTLSGPITPVAPTLILPDIHNISIVYPSTLVPTTTPHNNPLPILPADSICTEATNSLKFDIRQQISALNSTCGICSGDACRFGGAPQKQCTRAEPNCATVVHERATGERSVERKCMSDGDCYRDWWRTTSDMRICFSLGGDPAFVEQNCTFCCKVNGCNNGVHLVPEPLWQPPSTLIG